MASTPRPRHTNRRPMRVTILAAIITSFGVIIAAIVGALITGIFNHQSSPNSPLSVASVTATINPACAAAPLLTAPPDGQTLTSRTVTLTWEAPQGCVPNGYTVRITANYDPEARPWIVDTGWAPTDYTYTFTTDGTYYWHIRACQPCTPFHPGSWAIRSFTIRT